MMSGVLAGAIMGLCAVFAHNFVQRRAAAVARLAATLHMPPRLLEIVATVLLAAPVAFVILYALNALGILTE